MRHPDSTAPGETAVPVHVVERQQKLSRAARRLEAQALARLTFRQMRVSQGGNSACYGPNQGNTC